MLSMKKIEKKITSKWSYDHLGLGPNGTIFGHHELNNDDALTDFQLTNTHIKLQ